ncbi:PaaI family thioesterase [Granulosicoccus sp. 3-233]|uniref:PaaI family thioesterase n=1 Tax=Granulosicoccus sp. 3-233 TaxID=3417969 RepID=UPI003D35692D
MSSEHQTGSTPETGTSSLLLSEEAFREILDERLPFAGMMGIAVDYFADDHVRLRARYNERLLRPGGTIAGPVMMGLADAALYALILSRIGPVELAVTTSLSINFLRKPGTADVVADARMLKLGKRLAVGEVSLFSEHGSEDEPVAHVTGTYSIPPPEQRV